MRRKGRKWANPPPRSPREAKPEPAAAPRAPAGRSPEGRPPQKMAGGGVCGVRRGTGPRPPLPQRVDRRVAEPDDGHGGGAPGVLRHAEPPPLFSGYPARPSPHRQPGPPRRHGPPTRYVVPPRRGTGSPSVQGTARAVTPLWAGCHGSVVRNALSVFKMENDLLQGPVLLKRPREYKGRGSYVQGKVHKNIQSSLTATAAFTVTAVVVGH